MVAVTVTAVPSIQPLRLFGANNANDSLNFAQVLSGYNGLTDNITTASAGAGSGAGTPAKLQRIGGQTGANTNEHDNTAGDAFNQSLFFKSDATGLGTSSIEINNTPLAPQPLEDYDFNGFPYSKLAFSYIIYDGQKDETGNYVADELSNRSGQFTETQFIKDP